MYVGFHWKFSLKTKSRHSTNIRHKLCKYCWARLINKDDVLKKYVPSGSICAFIRGIFVKIQMWHWHTANMLALNYCHIVTRFATCVSLLMQLCECVCVCVHTHTHIYLYICVCVSTVFVLWAVLIISSYYVTLGFFPNQVAPVCTNAENDVSLLFNK